MKLRILKILFVLIFLITFLVLYKGLQNPSIYTPKNNLEKEVPLFTTKIFDTNNVINSKEIFKENKFYLMNIWSSWCVPCIEEHPFLMKLSKKKNLEIIGLNYKDKNKNAKIFLKNLNNPYKVILLDEDGTISIEWGAYGVPETFLIFDKKIIKKIIGPINSELFLEIEGLIQ